MELICTRPTCTRPNNRFPDLDNPVILETVPNKFCTSCGMPLILSSRYLTTKLLGKGGFGTAFQAIDRQTPSNRICVVKQFQPSPDLTPDQYELALNLFKREAYSLEQLGNKHDQIPDLYAFFPLIVPNIYRTKEEKYFYLVQEFVSGKSLEQELQEKGKFDEDSAKEVLIEILKILEFVHGRNTIHRDIKPSNIMRNDQGILYLLDFGAVKQVTVGGTALQKPSTGIYSMGFAPPEQMSGGEVYPSTDLYALAVTILILMTQKEPSDLYDSYHSCFQWRSYVPSCSDVLGNILDRMLLPTPRDRFASAREILDLLLASNSPHHLSTPQAISHPPASQPPSQPHFPSTYPPTPHPISQPHTPSIPQPLVSSPQPHFSLREILINAGFTGYEGGLIFVALSSIFSNITLVIPLGVIIIVAMIFGLWKRIIEGKDLLIFAVLSSLVLLIPIFQHNFNYPQIIAISVFSGVIAIMVTSFFRLIYQLVSKFL